MRRRTMAATLAVLLAPGTVACGHSPALSFPAGTTMRRLHDLGRIVVGVKVDQPGLGFRNPATGQLEGFDIRIAQRIAAALGVRLDPVETETHNRESYLEQGRVDIVVGSYSITEARRRVVGQAGPYYVTGQQLLVRKEDAASIHGLDDLTTGEVCSVAGSTAVAPARARFGARLVQENTYTDCVRRLLNRSVRAVLNDGAVLLGYAAQQPNRLQVVGPRLSTENYGIGYPRGDLAFCRFLTDTIRTMEADGTWETAFRDTLGRAGVPRPEKPTPDPCRS